MTKSPHLNCGLGVVRMCHYYWQDFLAELMVSELVSGISCHGS